MTKGYYHKQMWYLFLKLLACMANPSTISLYLYPENG